MSCCDTILVSTPFTINIFCRFWERKRGWWFPESSEGDEREREIYIAAGAGYNKSEE